MFDFTEYKHNRYLLTLLDEGDAATGKLRKVRINVLSPEGECIEEVDVLTSADAVIFDNNRTLPQELEYQLTYTNSKPTTADVGGIKKGSTFVDVPFKDIFTKLFYPEADATVSLEANVDSSIIYQQGNNLSPITFTLDVTIGTNQIKSATLFRDGREEGTFKNFPVNGGVGYYSYTGEVSSTTEFFARIEDTKGGIVETDVIRIEFNQPIYIGVMDEGVDITESAIKAMKSVIDYEKDGGNISLEGESLSLDEQYIVIAYPSYTDNLEKVRIDDHNMMDISRAFDRVMIHVTDAGANLINYTVLKLSHITTQQDFKIDLHIIH